MPSLDDLLTAFAAALPSRQPGDGSQTPMVPGLYKVAYAPAPALLVELLARPYLQRLYEIRTDATGTTYRERSDADAEPAPLTKAVFMDMVPYLLETLPKFDRERGPYTDLRSLCAMKSDAGRKWLDGYYDQLWRAFAHDEAAAALAQLGIGPASTPATAAATAEPEPAKAPTAEPAAAPAAAPTVETAETPEQRRRRKDAGYKRAALARAATAREDRAADHYRAAVQGIILWLHELLEDPRASQTIEATAIYQWACACIKPQPNRQLFMAVLDAVVGARYRPHGGRATYHLPPLADLLAAVARDDGVNRRIKLLAGQAMADARAQALEEIHA